MKKGFFAAFAIYTVLALSQPVSAQSGEWKQQPIQGGVPGLWAVSMKDTGNGIASGMTDLGNNNSGVLRKTAGDPTWYPVPLGNFSPAIPGNFNAWYGASAFPGSSVMYICGNNSKVYKSTDDGLNWTQQTSGIAVSKTLFGMHFSGPSTGLVVGDDGVAFYTTNGGTSWSTQNTNTTQTLLAVHAAGGVWYASGVNNTVLKFTPPSTWQPLSVAPHNSFGQALADVKFVSAATGYTSGGNALLSGKVLSTTSSGASWSDAGVPNQGAPYLFNAMWWFSASSGWAANVFDAIYYTSNSGANWTRHSAIPTIGAGGGVTELSFPSFTIGYGSGGAIGGSGTSGWIIKWQPVQNSPVIATNDTLKFGTLSCGSSRDITLTVFNTGNTPLIIPTGGFVFSSPDFSLLSPALPQSIPASGQQDFSIRWTPAAGFSGTIPPGTTLTIQSNDPVNPNWVIALEGTFSSTRVDLAESHLVFNSICASQYTDLLVEGTPYGQNPRFLDWVHKDGDDGIAIVTPAQGEVINAPRDFTFRHVPTGTGNRTGSYYFISGTALCPDTAIVTFEGGVRQSMLDIPLTLDFGPACTEHAEDIILDLTNTGTGPVQIIRREYVSGNDLFPDVMGPLWGPVSQGNSLPYTFRFRPGQYDTGAVSATYRFILGPCADTVVATFSGYGVKQSIQIIPTNVLVLGPTPVGGRNDAQILVNNNTSVPVEIASITLQPSHPSISWVGLPALPLFIAPGGQLTLDIRYEPTKIETLSSTVCVKYTSPCVDSLCIAVTASSNDPPTIVVQSALNMGVQRCDTPIRDTLPVYNTGPGVLTLTNLLVGGPQASHFRVVSPTAFPVDIIAGDSAYIILEYASPVEGPSGAVLTIFHNDPKTFKHNTVSLSATREVYAFIVEGDTTSAIQACFGGSASRTYTIRNTSAHEVQIISIGVVQTGQRFSTGIIAVPNILQPGDTLPVTVTLTADFAGLTAGSLRIVSEPCMFSREIPLRGEGLRPELAFTPQELDFGNIPAGSSADITLEIRNAGLRGLSIDSIVYVPGSNEFSLPSGPAFPIQIDSGSAVAFNTRYAPLSGAGLSGTLCAYIGEPCRDTICIDVRGSSNTDVLSPDRPVVDIYLDPCSVGSSCESVVIKNFAAIPHSVEALTLQQSGAVFAISRPTAFPFTVNPSGEFLLEICAAGLFTGTDTATATITTSTGASPVVVRFIAHRDSVRLEVPSFFNMGVQARCETEIFRSIPVSNTGTADDTLDVVSGVSAPFSLGTPFPLALPAGQVTNVDLRFTETLYKIYTDTLILRSRRCGTLYSIALNAAYLERNFDVVPNPLAFGGVQTGTSITQTFTVQNLNLRNARMSEIIFSDAAFRTSTTLPLSLDSGKVLSIPVMFSPTEQRGYTGTLCVIIDQPCLDTICIDLSGSGIEGQLKLSPAAIDYVSSAQCIVRIDTVTLENTGGVAITIDSVHIAGPGAAGFRIINPITTVETLLPGQSRMFFVEFQAALVVDGPFQAALVVFTGDANQPRLEAQLTGVRVTQIVQQALLLDFGIIQAGTPETRTLSVTNSGSVAYTYTGANLPAGISIVPPLPLELLPGQSADFEVTLTGLQAGALNMYFSLLVGTPCEDSTIVTCTGTVTSGVSLVGALAAPVASCDTVPMYVLLHNPLGRSITVDDIYIEGVDGTSFTLQSPLPPVDVPAGDSLEILVWFIPDPARDLQYTAQCVVSITAGGVSSELRAVLTAIVYIPQLTLLGASDFGGVAVEDPPGELNVQYENTSPFPIRVTTADFSHPAFTFVSSNPALPAMIAPGGTIDVIVRFQPDTLGSFTGLLDFTISEPCNASFQTAYLGSGLPPSVVLVDLSVAEHSGAVDERIVVPVLLNSDLGSQGVDGWSVGLEFNRMMLFPLAVSNEGTLSSGMGVDMDWSFEQGTLRLSGNGGPLNPGTGALVNVEFLVLIGDAETTPLRIQDSVWLPTPSKISLTRQAGSFTLTDYCFADGKRLISADGRNFLHPAIPNPVESAATISYETAFDGYVEILVYDVMGMLVRTLVAENVSKGVHSISFEAQGLPTGTYFIIMTAGEFTQTRTVIVKGS